MMCKKTFKNKIDVYFGTEFIASGEWWKGGRNALQKLISRESRDNYENQTK